MDVGKESKTKALVPIAAYFDLREALQCMRAHFYDLMNHKG
jgi:hypothetical protein